MITFFILSQQGDPFLLAGGGGIAVKQIEKYFGI